MSSFYSIEDLLGHYPSEPLLGHPKMYSISWDPIFNLWNVFERQEKFSNILKSIFLGHPVLLSILLHSCCMSIWPKSAFFSHLLKRLTDGDWSQWIFGDWRQWKFGKNQQSTRLSTTRLSPTLTDAAPATCQIILQKYTPILGVYLA